MSILHQTPIAPPETPKELKLKRQAFQIKQMAREAYRKISEIQHRGIEMLWNNNELAPQEIIDELGVDALKIFQYHGALTEYLVTLAQAEGIEPDIKIPTNAFTVNPQTGKITVTDEPYTP